MAHGIGMNAYLTEAELRKWEIAYRSEYGGVGIIGWLPLFATKEEAQLVGERFKAENSFVAEIMIRHPAKMYSAY